jgi:hypothetical protein
MLDSLVDGKDRQIPGSTEPPGVEHGLQIAEHRDRTVRLDCDPVDEVRSREVEIVPRHPLALVADQSLGVVAEQVVQIHDLLLPDACGAQGPA